MEYTLEKLEVYLLSEVIPIIREIVTEWDSFLWDTVGKQIVSSAASISANIVEGYGRYFYEESRQVFFYSRGSIQETKSWLSTCKSRKIIEKVKAQELINEADKMLAKLNAYVKFIAGSAKHNKKD